MGRGGVCVCGGCGGEEEGGETGGEGAGGRKWEKLGRWECYACNNFRMRARLIAGFSYRLDLLLSY